MDLEDLLNRGVSEIIKKDSLLEKLKSGKKLRIKHGVDATATELTLGHSVVYLKMREFQKLGHKIVFLIGEFTSRIGDPTDRKESRAMQSKEEVEKNAQNYLKQVGKILDLNEAEIRKNSEWYEKMSLDEFTKILSKFSQQQLIERDMFQQRIKNGKPIWMHELIYPILQGYDSVMLKSDLTIIGSDQIFNEIQGRVLQEIYGQEPQDLLAVPLLVGTDGIQKMSKSLGNYIGLEEDSSSMFGKIMSLPDNVIIDYFTLTTTLSLPEIRQLDEQLSKRTVNPIEIKKKLAKEIVSFYHSKTAAESAEREFEKVSQKKEIPSKVRLFKPKTDNQLLAEAIIDAGFSQSKSQAKRLIQQGAVEIDGKQILDPSAKIMLKTGQILKVGKRGYVKIDL